MERGDTRALLSLMPGTRAAPRRRTPPPSSAHTPCSVTRRATERKLIVWSNSWPESRPKHQKTKLPKPAAQFAASAAAPPATTGSPAASPDGALTPVIVTNIRGCRWAFEVTEHGKVSLVMKTCHLSVHDHAPLQHPDFGLVQYGLPTVTQICRVAPVDEWYIRGTNSDGVDVGVSLILALEETDVKWKLLEKLLCDAM